MAVRAADIELYFHSNVKGALSGIKQLDNGVNRLGGRMKWFDAFATAIAGRALTQKIFGAVDEAIQFETQMNNVNSIAKVSDATLRDFGVTLEDMAIDWGQAPVAMAGALYQVQSAGFAANDAIKILDASNKAAVAGLTTTEVAADALTSTLNAYGKGADKAEYFANVMFRAVDQGKITFEQLASTIGDNVALAAQVGVSFNELGAAFAMATQKGVPYNEVSTQLNAIMTAFIKPSEDMSAALAAQGYASGEALLKAEGLSGGLKFLERATGGNTEALALLLPNIRALRGAVALMGGDYDGFLKAMEDAQGGMGQQSAMQSALEEQTKSTSFQINRLKAAFSVLKIELMSGTLPAITVVAKAVTVIAKSMARLPEPIRQVIALVSMMTAIFIGLFGAIALFGPAIGTVVSALAVAIPIIGLFVSALVGLAYAWKSDFFGIKSITEAVVDSVVGKFNDLKSTIGPLIDIFRHMTSVQGESTQGMKSLLSVFRTQLRAAGLSAEATFAISDALESLHIPIRRVASGFGMLGRMSKQWGHFMLGESINLKKFKSRLTHLFGADIGKQFYDSTFRLRRSLRGLKNEFMKTFFGIDPNSPEGKRKFAFFKALSTAAGAAAAYFRSAILPAIGQGLVWAMEGATAAARFLSHHMETIGYVAGRVAGIVGGGLSNGFKAIYRLLHGDVRGALDAVIDQFQLLGQAGLDLADWVLNVAAPQVILWATDLWQWIKDDAGPAFWDGVVDITDWILNVAAPHVIGWVSDGYSWLKGNISALLFGTPASIDGTAGPDTGSSGIVFPFAGWVVNVLEPTVTSWVSDVYGWLTGKITGLLAGSSPLSGIPVLGGVVGGPTIDISDVLVNIKEFVLGEVDAAGTLATQVSDWAKLQTFEIKEYTINALAPAVESIALDVEGIKANLAEKIKTTDWGTILTTDSFNFGENLGVMARALLTQLFEKIGEIDVTAEDAGTVAGKILDGIAAAIVASVASQVAVVSAIAGFINGLVFGDDDIDGANVAGAILNGVKASLMFNPIGAVAMFHDDIIQFFSSMFESSDIAGAISDAIVKKLGGGNPLKDVPILGGVVPDTTAIDWSSILSKLIGDAAPDLPGWLTDFGWITGPVGDLVSTIEEQIGKLKDAWQRLQFWKDPPSAGTDTPGTTGPTIMPRGANIMPGGSDPAGSFSPGEAIPVGLVFKVDFDMKEVHKDIQDKLTGLVRSINGGAKGVSPIDLKGIVSGGSPFDGLLASVETAVASIESIAGTLTGKLQTKATEASGAFATGLQTGFATSLIAAFNFGQDLNSVLSGSISYDDGYGLGVSFGSGFVGGIASQAAGAFAAGMALGNAAKAGTALAGLVHSPSKAMAKLGNAYVDGFLQPFDRRKGEVQGVVDGVGDHRRSPSVLPMSNSSHNVTNVFVLDTEQWIAVQRDAKAGGQFARSMGHGARIKTSALGYS